MTPITCPIDGTDLGDDERQCPKCGEDLSALVYLRQLPQQMYEEGVRQARAGQLDDAAESLTAALRLVPDLAGAQVVLGKVYAQQGRYDEAIAIWRRVLARDPDNPKAQAGIQAAEARQKAAQARARRRRTCTGLLAAVGVIIALLGGFGLSQAWQAMQREGRATPQAYTTPTLQPTFAPASPTPRPPTATAEAAPSPETPPTASAAERTLTFALEQVQQALQAGPLADYPLEAQPVGSGVQIVGIVPSLALKALAEERVKAVPGVELVDSSGLQVVLPPVAEVVQAALSADEKARAWDLQVELAGEGSVVLRGTVPSTESRRHLEAIVLAVPEVRFLDSSAVDIEAPSLAPEVQALLQADPDLATAPIEVEQQEDDILLKGSVPVVELKARAEALAHEVPGVDLVDSTTLLVVPPPEYRVRPGDSLWSIAEGLYGDGRRWRDLHEANRDRIVDPGRIVTGTRLRVP
jgi:nucleoid-associated protein YgaU